MDAREAARACCWRTRARRDHILLSCTEGNERVYDGWYDPTADISAIPNSYPPILLAAARLKWALAVVQNHVNQCSVGSGPIPNTLRRDDWPRKRKVSYVLLDFRRDAACFSGMISWIVCPSFQGMQYRFSSIIARLRGTASPTDFHLPRRYRCWPVQRRTEAAREANRM